ncbi:MAG TPA: 4Fe-4S dicluster domain-containing protein, partial [Candidatus Sulfotelmatobacter sp.]
VLVQNDVCNGCGYCVVTCPFGVIDRRPEDGRAFKCTFCYDRQKAGLMPACAKACPTQSIQFGELEELQARARNRVQELQQRGYEDARLYDPQETSVGGVHAFFVILGEPENYNLPPAPEVPTSYLKSAWTSALICAVIALGIVFLAFAL